MKQLVWRGAAAFGLLVAGSQVLMAQTINDIPAGALLTPIPPALTAVATPRPSLTGLVKAGQETTGLIRLGKALFWDQQVGGDGTLACASCHFHAGVDHRKSNQASPGKNNAFDKLQGPGKTQTSGLFPFGWNQNIDINRSIMAYVDDVMGSQGTNTGDFRKVWNKPADQTSKITGHRQVTGRNAPSSINATFNFRNFWDGRAAETFNGVSPFGAMDQSARILYATGTSIYEQKINLPFSSLASQAVGPANNDVEMSFKGRDWADLGYKMLPRKPLAFQNVRTDDSVLGRQANTAGTGGKAPTGLTYANYQTLVNEVFETKYTTTTTMLCYDTVASRFTAKDPRKNCTTGKASGYTLAQANFSLFFGLAVQAYEQTLRSDQSRFDAWTSGTVAFTPSEFNGVQKFYGPVAQCGVCHFGSEFSSASVSFLNLLQGGGAADAAGFPVANLNRGVFNSNQLISAPPPAPLTTTLGVAAPACNGGPCEFAVQGASNGTTTYADGTVLRGPDKRFVGPFERMPMAYRIDSTGNQVAVNPLNPFNLDILDNIFGVAQGSTASTLAGFGTPLGTPNANQDQSPFAIYDLGFYNIGTQKTADDAGVGGFMPNAMKGTAPFPIAGSDIPLSMTRRMKANQATRTALGDEDRDYWNPSASFSAFAFSTCVTQENGFANICALPGAGPGCLPPPAPATPVAGVVPFATAGGARLSSNIVDPRACNFFNQTTGAPVINPITLQPLVGGRMLNGAPYQVDASGNASPDISCSTTGTTYGAASGTCPGERDAVDGAMKVPSLRNVELTGPYFHNGSANALLEAVKFYTRGAHHTNFPLSPEILGIGNLGPGGPGAAPGVPGAPPPVQLTEQDELDIMAFLLTLTDDRVAREKGPFDHPSLCLVEGQPDATDKYYLLPAVGSAGNAKRLETFEQMLASNTETRGTCAPY